MTDKEFEQTYKTMEHDARLLRFHPHAILPETEDMLADSLEFAAKMLRVYDRNIRAILKELLTLKHENSRLKFLNFLNEKKIKEIMDENH